MQPTILQVFSLRRGERHKFHLKKKTDIALIAISVFRVTFNMEFTRQAMNSSIESGSEKELSISDVVQIFS